MGTKIGTRTVGFFQENNTSIAVGDVETAVRSSPPSIFQSRVEACICATASGKDNQCCVLAIAQFVADRVSLYSVHAVMSASVRRRHTAESSLCGCQECRCSGECWTESTELGIANGRLQPRLARRSPSSLCRWNYTKVPWSESHPHLIASFARRLLGRRESFFRRSAHDEDIPPYGALFLCRPSEEYHAARQTTKQPN